MKCKEMLAKVKEIIFDDEMIDEEKIPELWNLLMDDEEKEDMNGASRI